MQGLVKIIGLSDFTILHTVLTLIQRACNAWFRENIDLHNACLTHLLGMPRVSHEVPLLSLQHPSLSIPPAFL